MPPMVEIKHLRKEYKNGQVAVKDLNMSLEKGDIFGFIGPNGAGKTTLFNCLSRLYQPSEGEILFQGQSVLATPRHLIASMGIGRTFQNVALFDRLTVLENVMVGRHGKTDSSFFANALRLPAVVAEQKAARERAMELIDFMDLSGFVHWPAGGLPFPIRKRVELARALAAQPKLLLLDEPAAGLNHEEVATLEHQIRRVRDVQGVTVLLVEHHMSLVMSVSDKVVTVNFGRKIAEGTPDEVRRHPEVIRAYLGTAA